MSGPRTVRLNPGEYTATIEKIAKINDRAIKRGFTGTITVEGTRVEVKDTGPLGFNQTVIMYDTVITGDPPCYGGWTFLAAIDQTPAGPVINTVPGVTETIPGDSIRPGVCDHCQTDRKRNRIFLVDHDDGRRMQIGSTCIKDFLGWDTNPVFFTQSDFDDDDLGGGGFWPDVFDVRTVVGVAWAVTAVFGFVPKSAYDGQPTAYTLADFLNGRTKPFDSLDVDRVRALAADADERADEIIAFILSDDFTDFNGGNYASNMKVLVSNDYVDPKHYGMIASAPNALARFREQQATKAAEQAERETYADEWLGEVKERLTLDVTVKAIRFIDGTYGTTTLYTMLTADNHVVKWFSSNYGLGEDVEGEAFRIVGTVKKHDEYEGQKQTVLTRVKGEPIGVPA